MHWLSTLGRESARIVLHSRCIVCAEELPWRDRVASCCRACWDDLPKIRQPKCRRCALVWETDQEVTDYLCLGCREEGGPLDWIDAWGRYAAGLERVIHAFKFERHDFYSTPLGTLIAETYTNRGDFEFDVVVGVPMDAKKVRQRGYNQAHLLARAFAKRAGITLDPSLLTTTGPRRTQSSLARAERAENVRGAFDAPDAARGARVLVIDDICTTGETLRACAVALRRAGATRVGALAVARA